MRDLMHWNNSANHYLVLPLAASSAVTNEICEKHPDRKYLHQRNGLDECTISAPVIA